MTRIISIYYIFNVKNDDFSYLSSSLEDFLKDAGFSSAINPVENIESQTSVLTTVGITGDKVGFLTLAMDTENAVSLSRLFSKLMEIPIDKNELSDAHLEALAELTNQISGRVVMFMEDHDLNCSITPPSIMSGGDISFSLKTMNFSKTFKVDGKHGFFYITIGIK